MDRNEIFDQIKEIISDKTGMEPNEITSQMYLEDDLNLGPMEQVEIFSDVEEALEVEGILEQKDVIETVEQLLEIALDKVE